MIQAKRSSVKSSWKYLLIIMLIGFSMASFNPVRLTNQNSEAQIASALDLNETDNGNEEDTNAISNAQPFTLDDPTIVQKKDDFEPDIKNQHKAQQTEQSGLKWEYAQLKPGHWAGKIKGDKVCFYLNNSDWEGKWNWQIQECFSKKEVGDLPIGTDAEFRITREPGTLIMNGSFKGEEGEGRFEFEENESFAQYLENGGIGAADQKALFQMFLSNTNKSFIAELKSKRYAPSVRQLVTMGIHGVDRTKLNEFHKIFDKISHKDPQIKELVDMAIHGVNIEFVEGLTQIKSDEYPLERVIEAKIHGITPEYLNGLKSYEFSESLDLKGVIEFAIHDVNIDELKELKKLGYTQLTPKNVVQFAIHDVNADFVGAVSDLGYGKLAPNELIDFAIHNVSISHIRSLKDLGYDNLSSQELINTKIHDVSPEYIASIHKLGYKDISIDQLQDFSIHGVSKRYIRSLQEAGIKDLSAKELVTGRIHNVTGEYAKDLDQLGITGLSFEALKSGKIHNVSVSFIEGAREKGYSPNSLSEFVVLKIAGI